ncbi:hypothetical protein Pryu01_01120 [Paraliobacillus ryukyuensis]|uniref:Uncharacterized protein n=1 Tax=Paraliobacillus ryukyuensis TaxID=200904 RepID=A0A366EDB9_9BACI|nr:hypothetical protein [Paraliobacillus ryukyuensis]RBP00308.1 hypothetical protein DES48_10269 [Paraliobacillus ryukyuensis]
MAKQAINKRKLIIPLSLFVVNVIFFAFFIEETIDASPPNYGSLGFSCPIIGFISLLYIGITFEKKHWLLRTLQVFNGIFILYPIAEIIYFIMLMV